MADQPAYWGNLPALANPYGIQFAATVPPTQGPDVIYVPGYGIMRWVAAAGIYLSEDVGDMVYVATATPRVGQAILNGDIVDKAGRFAGLWYWAQQNGLAASNHIPGYLKFQDVNSATMRLPNVCGRWMRNFSQGLAPDLGRLLGSPQDPQNMAHGHTGTTDIEEDHEHSVEMSTSGIGDADGGDSPVLTSGNENYGPLISSYVKIQPAGRHGHFFSTNDSGGAEVRVLNTSANFVIHL